jgi:hypothetical protein
MTTNFRIKIIERESGIKPKQNKVKRFKITPDAVIGGNQFQNQLKIQFLNV